ncbi:DUF3426 domain-containing protein [Pseudomonas syringae]|uniref:Zinc finger/thioredoxin putative domain-containing protein n=1 Tax=Pseudomonas syringae TaxID=317 RepID=A0A085V924_PSESX|nr:DUF3426 domain-containing protein [Pseudomonas syringae]KFE51937.1 hypothetical protein IV01_22700 [Pseudomonas syringae]
MTDSFVTQCPHCQTSFRVSHAQLSVARGVVRCGACLQVFNAAKQLLEQRSNQAMAQQSPELVAVTPAPPSEVAEAPPALPVMHIAPEPEPQFDQPKQTPAEPFHAPESWRANALDLDSLDLDEELARLEQREIQLPETFGRDNTRETNQDHHPSLTAQRDTSQTESDDWVDSLQNDDVKNELPGVNAEVIADPDLTERETREDERDGRTEPSFSSSATDIEDDEPMAPVLSQRKAPHSGAPKGSHKGSTQESAARFSAVDHDELDDADDLDEPEPDPRSRRNRSEPGVRDQTLLDLTDDPLQLEWQRPKSRWGRKLIWTLLTLLALAGLAGQYVWYHFDELARQDQYRPWFQMICPKIDCKVPSKVDISLLKSSNLVVRSHPEFKGALVVDAIIYNRAAFSQPFPLLELRFADTSGQLIASRRFKPAEYLSGEIAGKEEMPPQTPIHIALDILDPGAKAVNYSLSFRSPE